MDLLELFKAIQDSSLPEYVHTKVGEYLLNPSTKKYELLPPERQELPVKKRTVTSMGSLISVVKEETLRRNKPLGEDMSVFFTQKGAIFFPEDKEPHHQWVYTRTNSPAWLLLIQYLGKSLTQKDLITLFQCLKKYIENYPQLFNAYKKLNITDNSQMESSAIIENGEIGESYSFRLKIESADPSIVKVPTGFTCSIPFHLGANAATPLEVLIDINRVHRSNRFIPEYELRSLDVDALAEKAISEEQEYFSGELKELTRLLTVINYS